MIEAQRTFVLVHGAWHGGWCWRRVADLLEQRGHRVFTPTLTGLGERSHLMSADINLDTHIADVVNVLTFEDLHDVVLVGHSMGGIVIPRVAEVVPERIGRVVWLAAAVTNDTENLMQAVPKSRWVGSMVMDADGTAHLPGDIADLLKAVGRIQFKKRDSHLLEQQARGRRRIESRDHQIRSLADHLFGRAVVDAHTPGLRREV